MQSITINITKNFGKSITLELPSGDKHVITHSHSPHLYADLQNLIKKYEDAKTACSFDTFRLPDDYEFGDERIDLENISD